MIVKQISLCKNILSKRAYDVLGVVTTAGCLIDSNCIDILDAHMSNRTTAAEEPI